MVNKPCPNCGYIEIEYKCEVQECTNEAEYEGWHRVLDFAGIPSGLIRLRRVCNSHIGLLIGKEVSLEDGK